MDKKENRQCQHFIWFDEQMWSLLFCCYTAANMIQRSHIRMAISKTKEEEEEKIGSSLFTIRVCFCHCICLFFSFLGSRFHIVLSSFGNVTYIDIKHLQWLNECCIYRYVLRVRLVSKRSPSHFA